MPRRLELLEGQITDKPAYPAQPLAPSPEVAS
jgi:hypothetical protein